MDSVTVMQKIVEALAGAGLEIIMLPTGLLVKAGQQRWEISVQQLPDAVSPKPVDEALAALAARTRAEHIARLEAELARLKAAK